MFWYPFGTRFRALIRLSVVGARYRRSVAATADATTHSLADHHPIGISTGAFDESRGDWPALVDAACSASTFAVELSALSGDELAGLITYLLGKPSLPFRYVSVHAPVKHQGSD